jgi:hypothetical protein
MNRTARNELPALRRLTSGVMPVVMPDARAALSAQLLRTLRLDLLRENPRDWTQAAIASRGGPPVESQSKFENGDRTPKEAALARLAGGYGLAYETMRDYLDGRLAFREVRDLCHVRQKDNLSR